MKNRALLVVGICILAALASVLGHLAGAGSARAAAGTPRNVGAYSCINFLGGHRNVPAGSTIVIRSGWASGSPGAVTSFINAQTTILSVNDAHMIDVSGGYEAPHPDGAGNFVSVNTYPTGVTLANPGDSMRFTYALLLKRRVTDVYDVDGDGNRDPAHFQPGLVFGGTCTVTAT